METIGWDEYAGPTIPIGIQGEGEKQKTMYRNAGRGRDDKGY